MQKWLSGLAYKEKKRREIRLIFIWMDGYSYWLMNRDLVLQFCVSRNNVVEFTNRSFTNSERFCDIPDRIFRKFEKRKTNSQSESIINRWKDMKMPDCGAVFAKKKNLFLNIARYLVGLVTRLTLFLYRFSVNRFPILCLCSISTTVNRRNEFI